MEAYLSKPSPVKAIRVTETRFELSGSVWETGRHTGLQVIVPHLISVLSTFQWTRTMLGRQATPRDASF